MIVDEPFNPNKYPLRDYASFSIEVPIHGDRYGADVNSLGHIEKH